MRRGEARLGALETEVLARVESWAGGRTAALKWYRDQPIPALGHQTADVIVRAGRARDVSEHPDLLSLGGLA